MCESPCLESHVSSSRVDGDQQSAFYPHRRYQEKRRIAREPDLAAEILIKQRDIWPPGFIPQDDTVLYSRIYWSLRSAREYGLTQIGARGSWVMLGSCFLPYFWLTDTGNAYLSRPGCDPHVRYADYYAVIKSLNKRQANPWPMI
jgi:hypothetical protein